DLDLLADRLHLLPPPRGAVAGRVLRVGLDDDEVGLVGADDGDAPRDAVVVSDRHARQAWLAGPDHVPARRVEVDQVAQRRQRRSSPPAAARTPARASPLVPLRPASSPDMRPGTGLGRPAVGRHFGRWRSLGSWSWRWRAGAGLVPCVHTVAIWRVSGE